VASLPFLSIRQMLRFVVFEPDGQTLVSVSGKGTLRFWDAPSPNASQPRKPEQAFSSPFPVTLSGERLRKE